MPSSFLFRSGTLSEDDRITRLFLDPLLLWSSWDQTASNLAVWLLFLDPGSLLKRLRLLGRHPVFDSGFWYPGSFCLVALNFQKQGQEKER